MFRVGRGNGNFFPVSNSDSDDEWNGQATSSRQRRTYPSTPAGAIQPPYGRHQVARATAAHTETGKYELVSKILSWPATLNPQKQDHLGVRFNLTSIHTRPRDETYYEQFKPHIIEEIRAMLAQALEERPAAISMQVAHFKPSRNEENPSVLTMNGTITGFDFPMISVVVKLWNDEAKFLMLGVASENDRGLLEIKVLARENTESNAFGRNSVWSVHVLGSIVSHIRMYEACTRKSRPSFFNQVLGNRFEPAREAGYDDGYDSDNYPVYTQRVAYSAPRERISSPHLNPSQLLAVQKFCDSPDPLVIWEGPPGTGKTTTIVELGKILVDKRQRTLITAPSNKAIQVIAERFYKKYGREIPIALAGVTDKISEKLKPEVCIHTWPKRVLDRLVNLEGCLNKVCQALQEIEDEVDQYRANYNEDDNYCELTGAQGKIVRDSASQINQIETAARNIGREIGFYIPSLLSQTSPPQRRATSSVFNDVLLFSRQLLKYIQTLKTLFADQDNVEIHRLNEAKIIFMTLSTAGRSQMESITSVHTVIIDEAGQAVEPECCIPFHLKPKRCLLVGDTNQLPPTVISREAEQKGYARPMMARLLQTGFPKDVLGIQYRMHPEIRQWPSQKYYENRLQDAPSILQRPPLFPESSPFGPYSFIDVANGREADNGSSKRNQAEAQMVVGIVRYLRDQLKIDPRRIGVLSFYSAQAELLTQSLRPFGIKADSVDSFQGNEHDIVIISFVRANRNKNIGFLSDFRRLNVAITRARESLIMLGHFATLSNTDSDISEMLQDALERESVYEGADIFEMIAPAQPERAPRARGRGRGGRGRGRGRNAT